MSRKNKIKLNIRNKIITSAILILISFSFSSIAIATQYTEGEDAYNQAQDEVETKEFLMKDVCFDEKGKCLDAVKLRVVDGMLVERDCWKYEYVKNCSKGPSKDNCANIQQDDFKFVGDTCLHTMKVNGKSFCINMQKTFSRITKQTQNINRGKIFMDPDNKEVVKNLLCDAFCLDGNCSSVFKETQGSNDEIASAIAQLEMLSNIKKGMIDANGLRFDIFSGNAKRCHNKGKGMWSNCCKDTGFVKDLGIVKCSRNEISIREESIKGRCEYIGEYCSSDKPIIGCIRKTRSYCCFPTVLAKVIHRGARSQLGKTLGSAEHPQCGGLTLEDIEKIDFSKIDFQDFFDLEVQPMMKGYSTKDNEDLVKRSFPSGGQSTDSDSFPNVSKDGVNEKLFKNSE